MKIEISSNGLREGKNVGKNRKANHFSSAFHLITLNGENEFTIPLEVRFYQTDAKAYCCLWGNIGSIYFSGGGGAGGYGYDKKSAAFEDALIDAGFSVYGLSGTGMNEQAIESIAKNIMNLKTGSYIILHSH